ncbi:succinylglutamate desuccinylase/aspartoacylase family protein [Roseibium sp. LAB1]
MLKNTIAIPGYGAGTTHELTVLTFGNPGARPHVHVQSGLHADEGPGMLAARLLADRLQEDEDAGSIKGCVTIVPFANPLGLNQFVNGDQTGRFDLYDGRNFNRDYPDLAAEVAREVEGELGPDAGQNAALIRSALRTAVDRSDARTPSGRLRRHLLKAALEADVVLDLHCDGEAEVHLYTQPASSETILPLASFLQCRAVLIADVSGGDPFDEALVKPWQELARRHPDLPIPTGCATCTVELRGRAEVCRSLASRDADSLLQYLTHLGVLDGTAEVPERACDPTPLAGSEALVAPASGLLSYVTGLGSRVAAGETIAEITDLETGKVTPVKASTAGVFYARPATRIAEVGKRLGKIAGTTPFRQGPLLSP